MIHPRHVVTQLAQLNVAPCSDSENAASDDRPLKIDPPSRRA